MLSQRVAGGCDPRLTAPNARYLLECVNAATTTIVIFDLFCSTFGYGRCVLSLSYSVYIAASIFLLQVQANVNDNLSFQRLKFCIHALDRLKSVNPGNYTTEHKHSWSSLLANLFYSSHWKCLEPHKQGAGQTRD